MKRNIRLMMIFNFFTDLRFDAPILILYFTQVTGSLAAGMSILSINALSAAIFEVPTGVFSDMIGRKKTAIIGSFSLLIGMMLYALGTSYWMLFIGAIFEGLSRSFYSGNNEALLYDTVADMGQLEHFAEYLGKASSMFQFALMMASLVGGFLSLIDFRVVMMMSVIPQIICFILAWFFIEPHIHKKESTNIYSHMSESIAYLWKNKKLRLLTLARMIDFGVGEANWSFRSTFLEKVWPLWAVGLYRTITHFSSSISYWFGGKIVKKFGPYNILVYSGIYYRLVNFIGLFMQNIFSPFIMLTSAPLYGVVQTANRKLLHEEFTDNERATIDSLGSLLGNILFAVFAPLLGLIGDMWGPTFALIIGQVCLFPLMGINYFLFKKHGRET